MSLDESRDRFIFRRSFGDLSEASLLPSFGDKTPCDSPPGAAVIDNLKNVDKVAYLVDIATDLDLTGGHALGHLPTGICRPLRRLT